MRKPFSKIRLQHRLSDKAGTLILAVGIIAACFWGIFEKGAFMAPNSRILTRTYVSSGEDGPKLIVTSKPSLSENRALRFAYEASDESGVTEIALRVTPHNPQPGANNATVEIPLPTPPAKRLVRTDVQDISSRPWAGQTITVQLVATNELGKRTLSAPFDLALPERRFLNPVAQVLVEQRDKLLQNPDSDALREEAATIMAGFAQQPASYYDDPVVFMALRSGAVRLVLGHSKEASISVNDLLWQIATHIENSNPKTVRQSARDSSKL